MKRRRRLDTLLLILAALPIIVVDQPEYDDHLLDADRRMRARDPDDVDVLALALHLKLPVWTNDNDFEECGIEDFPNGGGGASRT